MGAFRSGQVLAGFIVQVFRHPCSRGLAAVAGVFALTLSIVGAACAQESLKLGVLNDFQGSFADLGGAGSILAAQMAVEDFGGQVLGKPIVIISADSQNKPDVATGIARRWFDVEKVDAIIDPVPSTVALGVQDLARERNKLARERNKLARERKARAERKMVIVASSGLADVTGKNCTPTSFQWAYDTLVVARGTGGSTRGQGGGQQELVLHHLRRRLRALAGERKQGRGFSS